MIELLDRIVGKYIYSFTPFLTRAEVIVIFCLPMRVEY